MSRQRKLSPEQIDELISRYNSGASTRELATEFGAHRHTIRKHLAASEIGLRTKRRRLGDATVAKASQLYQDGWTLAQLAAEYGVGQETIRRELLSSGLTLRSRGGRR